MISFSLGFVIGAFAMLMLVCWRHIQTEHKSAVQKGWSQQVQESER